MHTFLYGTGFPPTKGHFISRTPTVSPFSLINPSGDLDLSHLIHLKVDSSIPACLFFSYHPNAVAALLPFILHFRAVNHLDSLCLYRRGSLEVLVCKREV